MRLAGIKMIHAPFQGWAHSSVAVLGGHIDAVVAQPGELKGQVDGKRMRVLINFMPQRHPVFPDVPTAKELGWDVANGVWYLLMVPKGTPAPVVKYLHDAAKEAIDDPKFGRSWPSAASTSTTARATSCAPIWCANTRCTPTSCAASAC